MSKKATRRAVRQAFPKAKTPPPSRKSYGNRPRRPSTSRGTGRPVAKPPSVRRAVTWAFIMALIYFVLIEWGWKSGATMLGNFIIALVAFVGFVAVIYAVDRFKYKRYLNKQKGSSK